MRLIVLLLTGCLWIGACDKQKVAERQGGREELNTAQTTVKGLDRSHSGEPLPDIVVTDGSGEDVTLSELNGSPLLVNLWASWCVPCVRELPTLDALAAKETGLTIVALSQDVGPLASVSAFLAKHGIAHLEPYQDADMAMSDKMKAPILPTTFLFDSRGREVWRFVGDRDWMSADAAKDLAAAKED